MTIALRRAGQVASLSQRLAYSTTAWRGALLQTQLPRTAYGHVARHGALLCAASGIGRPVARYYSTEKPSPSPPENNNNKKNPKENEKDGEQELAAKAKDGSSQQQPSSSSSSSSSSNSNSSSSSGEDSSKEVPLPEGWVRLSKEELKTLNDIVSTSWIPKGYKRILAEHQSFIEKYGAPKELVEFIKDTSGSGLSISKLKEFADAWDKVVRHVMEVKMRGGLEDLHKKGEQGKEAAESAKDEAEGAKQQGEDGSKSGGSKTGNKNKEDDSKKRPSISVFGHRIAYSDIIASIVVYIAIDAFFGTGFFSGSEQEITWQEVRKKFLDRGLVERFIVEKERVVVILNEAATRGSDGGGPSRTKFYFTIGSVESFEKQMEEAQNQLGIPPSERIPVTYSRSAGMFQLLLAFGPNLLLIGLLVWTARGLGGRGGAGGGQNSIFSMGKTRAKIYSESEVKVKFSDVAGMEEAKVEIMEFVSFLKQPERFRRLGAKIPRGAILSGPPGTGKTLLAKATAGESGVPFYSVSGSEFVEIFVGVGPSRVRDLFASARKNAPCIIFIDEIDAIGQSRQSGNRMGGNDEREATLNQILTEMDGFNTSEQVVVLAGTNRAEVLDKALMRPGRFDRHIYIDRPTMKGRQEIFKVHLRKIVTSEDIEQLVGRLASLTPGFSGADVANVVNEAALVAARENAASVTVTHFERAIERVIGGLERKSLVLKPNEKRTVAYHEAGHAICGWYLEHADPLLKVSIIPRGQGALGYAQYLPLGDTYLMNINQLMDRMAMTLGGRVSEELHFPTVTTGGSDDFKKVTQMARLMVTEWGMSAKVGPIHFENNPNAWHKPFAEGTAQAIDAEVSRIVQEAYARCRKLLEERKEQVGLVAEELLKKEMLTRDDMVRLLGRRQWGHDEEFEKYFGGGGEKSAPEPFPQEQVPATPPVEGQGVEGTTSPTPPPPPSSAAAAGVKEGGDDARP